MRGGLLNAIFSFLRVVLKSKLACIWLIHKIIFIVKGIHIFLTLLSSFLWRHCFSFFNKCNESLRNYCQTVEEFFYLQKGNYGVLGERGGENLRFKTIFKQKISNIPSGQRRYFDVAGEGGGDVHLILNMTMTESWSFGSYIR